MKRTPRIFIEDLLTEGRTAREIVAVAENTHWKGDTIFIKKILRKFSRKLKNSRINFRCFDDNRV